MGFFSFDFFCVGIVQLNEASTRDAPWPGSEGEENADLFYKEETLFAQVAERLLYYPLAHRLSCGGSACRG